MRLVILLFIFIPSISYSSVKEINVSLSGSNIGEIFSNQKNQIEVFVKVSLDEGEEIDWIKLVREQDRTDIQELGWLYRSPLEKDEEYYKFHGKYLESNSFRKTTQGNPFTGSFKSYPKRVHYNIDVPNNTYDHTEVLYLSASSVQTVDICAEVTLKSGEVATGCDGNEPSVTVRSINPSVIPSNQFSSTALIGNEDIDENNGKRHFTSIQAVVGPNALEGFISSIHVENSTGEGQLSIYDGSHIQFAGDHTSVYWSNEKTYHLTTPELRYFKYLTLGRTVELELNSIKNELNGLTNGSTHILNIISIPYDLQNSLYDTIWVGGDGVYNRKYNGCYFPPDREYVKSNKINCSRELSEIKVDEIKNRDPEIVIIDEWGTEHRISIGRFI